MQIVIERTVTISDELVDYLVTITAEAHSESPGRYSDGGTEIEIKSIVDANGIDWIDKISKQTYKGLVDRLAKEIR